MSNYANSVGVKTRTAEENRAEVMRRELNDMGIYEQMTSEEMENMLQALNDSKTSVGDQGSAGSDSVAMEIESTDALAEVSYTGPNHKQRSRDSSSPDLTSAFSNKQKHRRNSNESEMQPEPPRTREATKADANYLMSPSPPRGSAPQAPENQQNVTTRKPQIQTKLQDWAQHYPAAKTEKWKLDPLDCKKDDTPALKARRNQTAKPPDHYSVINGVPQLPKEIMNLMNMQLDEIVREHYASIRNDEHFQWGSPIKVGTANGSLDREPKRKRPSTPVGEPRTRVALRTQTDDKKSSDVYSYTENEEDEDFETLRKRQKLNTQKFYTNRPPRRTRAASFKAVTETDDVTIDDNGDSDWQEPRGSQSRKRSVKQRETNQEVQRKHERSPEYEALEIRGRQNSSLSAAKSRSSSPEAVEATPVYPRRIPPPNPSKPRGGGRGRKPNLPNLLSKAKIVLTKVDANTSRSKEATMTEDDIEKQLMTDDEDDIFVPKSVSRRVEGAAQMLTSAAEKEEQNERKKQEAERLKREQEQQQNRQRLQRQVEEEQQKRRSAVEAKREAEEKEQRYIALLKSKPSGLNRRAELEGNGKPRKVLPKPVDWGPSHQAVRSQSPPQSEVDNRLTPEVKCPICGKAFPKAEVQNHASTCTDYKGGSDVEEIVERTPSPFGRYRCMKCERFATWDGHEFEDHTALCTGMRRASASGSQSEPIQLSDSPIRTYRRVSEIVDSEVDYQAMKINAKKPSARGGPARKGKR